MINFSDIDVIVNGTGITAESVSINSQNSTSPAYVLGYEGTIGNPQTGPITNKINLSYLLELGTETNFASVNDIKNNPTGWTGVRIEVANLTGHNCYLEDYQLQLVPNDMVRASASYVSYNDISGSLNVKSQTVNYSTGKFAHSWSTSLSPTLLSFDYSFRADWQPVYIIGSGNKPVEVLFNGANENFGILSLQNIQIKHSGEPIENTNLLTAPLNTKLVLYPQEWINDNSKTTPSLTIDFSGASIESQETNVSSDNILTVNLSANKFF